MAKRKTAETLAKATPKAKAKTVLVPVYRCQLVEERRMAFSRDHVHGIDHAVELLWRFMDAPDREVLVVLMLDGNGHVLGLHRPLTGIIHELQGYLPDMLKAAVLRNAEKIVIAHNHPAPGKPQPSPQDVKLTRDVARAANTLQIFLVDHLIFGRTKAHYYSFLDHDAMPRQLGDKPRKPRKRKR